MTDTDIAELDDARQQLADRFRAHKPSTWSISLLRTLANAMDIEFGPPAVVERPRLQIIPGGCPMNPAAIVTEQQNVEARTLTGAGTPPDLEETRVAVRCNVCRRWLVDPESVVLGVDPTCRGDRG